MRRRRMVALALAVLAAACSGDSSGGAPTEPAATPTGRGDAALAAGVAARVDGHAIEAREVDARIEASAASDEQIAQLLAGAEGALARARLRARTLTLLLQMQLVLDSAAELGAEPDDADIERMRERMVAELGGEDAFAEAAAAAGLTAEAIEEQLRGMAALENVGRALVEQGLVDGLPEDVEGAEADVVVDPAYGDWDPETGQVMPAPLPSPGASGGDGG